MLLCTIVVYYQYVNLWHPLQSARLYTADFMRALLRLGVPFFSNWCMELLIKQLYDQSKNVSMRSLSVINEACENQVGPHTYLYLCVSLSLPPFFPPSLPLSKSLSVCLLFFTLS